MANNGCHALAAAEETVARRGVQQRAQGVTSGGWTPQLFLMICHVCVAVRDALSAGCCCLTGPNRS
jgi:hypothetical protein